MRLEIGEAVRSVDRAGWRGVPVEFGAETLEIVIPRDAVILSMGDTVPLSDPGKAVEKALAEPIGCPSLEDIVRQKHNAGTEATAAVVVSDITRPVPYKGKAGILGPLLRRLERAGVFRRNITIVVGTGMHRPSTPGEKAAMFGEGIVRDYRIVDHDCEDVASLVQIGRTARGTDVSVNAAFLSADVRVVTGLVESHFMAGVSGGRKAVCPALVDVRTIQKFHGPEFLESSHADNLILEGNPCHQEALEVARTVGVDFTVNVTLDRDMNPTGVFAGELEKAHMAAFEFMKDYAAIPIDREYDIVLTHAGYTGRDHYQTAKAGCGALPAVKKGGTIIIAADNRDIEPVGSPEYRWLLKRLKALGVDGYVAMLKNPAWTFTKDQWEPEMWGRVIRKVGEEGLDYCAPAISAEDDELLPGRSGRDFLEDGLALPDREAAQAMVQNALLHAVARCRSEGRDPSVAVLREGPYGIPLPRRKD